MSEVGDTNDVVSRAEKVHPAGKNASLSDVIQRHFGENVESETGGAPIRFRPPFIQTPRHDARGDAIALAFDYLTQRSVPYWAAHLLAFGFVNAYVDELQTALTPFVVGVYEPIDASVWCRKVVRKLEEYMLEVANQRIPLPEKPSKWDQLPYSYCSQKNRRSKMEDRAAIFPTLSVVEPLPLRDEKVEGDAFFAVFDGHNGVDCANYAGSHFVRCLLEDPNYGDVDIQKLMKSTFSTVDQRLEARCKHENIKGGTTAVCAFLRGRRELCVGWCGDSAVGVLRRDSLRTLSSAHSPDVEEEARRVEESGGMVVWVQGELRVNGILNLTRSLGDIDGRPMISPVPDVLSFALDGSEYLLMLACDGVWDSMNEAQIFNCVKEFVQSRPQQEYEMLAEYVSNEAKNVGSTDNLTLICVFLRPVADLWNAFK